VVGGVGFEGARRRDVIPNLWTAIESFGASVSATKDTLLVGSTMRVCANRVPLTLSLGGGP
jgi:hypothetical protein